MNSSESRRMILRRESFGGTLFHPDDATFVQVDPAGFAVLKRLLGERPCLEESMRAAAGEEREFLSGILGELPPRRLPARLVEHEVPAAAAALQVLSAPILVDFQITERCGLGCPQCYASSVSSGQDVSWPDAALAIAQMHEAGVCQIALGGGEPLLHPRLGDLLRLIADHGMVPNMTTTGVGMTAELMRAIRDHCGAVAMSLEGVGAKFALRRRQGFQVFERNLRRFLEQDVPLVLQITVSRGNIGDLDEIVDYCLGVDGLYGVVFLAHKPAGRATSFDQALSAGDHRGIHGVMMRAVRRLRERTRVGFDCCFSPAMTGFEADLGFARGTIVEGCSATRSGVGLTPALDVLPCTFLGGERLGNLRERTLLEIWNQTPSVRFRDRMIRHSQADKRCRTCASNADCLGGCSAWSLTGCETKSAEPIAQGAPAFS